MRFRCSPRSAGPSSQGRSSLAAVALAVLLMAGTSRCSVGGYTAPPVPAPTIARFAAARPVITVGDSTELTGEFAYGLGQVDQGVGSLESAVPVPVQPASTTTYTLTVTGSGGSATAQATIQVLPVPDVPQITVAGPVGANASALTASVPDQPGCSFAWSIRGGSISSGADSPQITFSCDPFGLLTLTCTASNAAGKAVASAPASFPLGGPTLYSLTAAPTVVTAGAAVTLAYSYSGADTILLSPPASTVLAGGPVSDTATDATLTVTPTVSTTYTLSVRDSVRNQTDSLGVSVTVAPEPVITTFAASPLVLGPGADTELTADFDAGPGGSARVDPGGIPVLSGSPQSVGPLEQTTLFTLTVTNAAGTAVTEQVQVRVGSLALLAGTPSGEGSLDGTGAGARYLFPGGLASYAAGEQVVADTGNHVIRVLDAAGGVTTVAGVEGVPGNANGPVDQALFNRPTAVAAALAATGSPTVWVADTGNHAIRMIRDGVVSTLAATAANPGAAAVAGAAGLFSGPRGIAVTGDGAIVFFADTDNGVIREIQMGDGTVSLLAGFPGQFGNLDGQGSSARFTAPAGLAWDEANQVLYVADYGNNNVRTVDLLGNVATWAGDLAGTGGYLDGQGTGARFLRPLGLALDATGTLYLADTGNQMVRRIQDGTVISLAGMEGVAGAGNGPALGGAQFNAPGGLAVDPEGRLLVADSGNSAIRSLPVGGGAVNTFSGLAVAAGSAGAGGSANLYRPRGLALDPDGNLVVADAGNHLVRLLTGAGVLSTLAGTALQAGYVNGSASLARFASPGGVATAVAGQGQATVVVADTGNHVIRTIIAGQVATLAGVVPPQAPQPGDNDGPAGEAQFSSPAGVAATVDGQGDLIVYVADTGNHLIRVIKNGTVARFAGISGVAGHANGPALEGATFNQPTALAVDRQGNVIVADTGNHLLRKITPGGVVSTLAGAALQPGSQPGIGQEALLNGPVAVALDGAGNLLVANAGSSTVGLVTPDGTVSTLLGDPTRSGNFPGPLPARIAPPRGLAVDPDTDQIFLNVDDAVLTVDFHP